MSYLYDVFETQVIAQEALDFLALHAGYPAVNFNAETGEPATSNTKTKQWAVMAQRVTDGKWFFKRIKDEIRANYPQALIDAYMLIPHTEEVYADDWQASKQASDETT